MRSDDPILVDGRVVTDVAAAVIQAAGRRRIEPADPEPAGHRYSEQTMTFEEKVDWLREQGIAALRQQATGEFDLDELPPMHEYTAEWVQHQLIDPTEAPWLVLVGIPGCGKTSQSFCAARHLVLEHAKRGESYPWRFVTHRNFAAKVQRGSDEDPEEVMRRYGHFKGLLIFSDLGDFNNQDFGRAVDYTSRLVNHRYQFKLPTIYETNLLYYRTDEIAALEQELGRPIATMDTLLDDRVIERLRAGWTAPLPDINYRASKGRVMGT